MLSKARLHNLQPHPNKTISNRKYQSAGVHVLIDSAEVCGCPSDGVYALVNRIHDAVVVVVVGSSYTLHDAYSLSEHRHRIWTRSVGVWTPLIGSLALIGILTQLISMGTPSIGAVTLLGHGWCIDTV